MVGIPAKPTLMDAEEYQKDFMPYGTVCSDLCDPAGQRLEGMKAEIDRLQAKIDALLAERKGSKQAERQDLFG